MNDPALADANEYDGQYLEGMENRLIRLYFYLNRGLDVLNQFRNLFLGIIALYIALHLDNWLLLAAMFVPSVLVLMLLGYYNVHKMSKLIEWLNLRFSTHYGIKQFNYQQGIYDTLKEIKDKIK